MKALFLFAFFLSVPVFAEAATRAPNILFICVDDLRPELPAFGKTYIKAPTIEKLAAQGRLFKRHYVQVPTCGASRFSLLSGIYNNKIKNGTSNDAIRVYYAKPEAKPSFPQWFREHGYNTMAVGKISHYPGGHFGEDWNDPGKTELPNAWTYQPPLGDLWKTPEGLMHGYANGGTRTQGKTPPLEAVPDGKYPDDHIVRTFIDDFDKLTAEDKPWLCMVGLLRPHLPFACPKKYLDLYDGVELPPISDPRKPDAGFWHKSGELLGSYQNSSDPRSDGAYATLLRKHYAACVSYTDSNVAKILAALEKSGQADNTIIVLWGDHGWHLGEKSMWGKHSPYEVALHSPLIIKTPGMANPGPCDSIVETVDIYPTLCSLAGLPSPSHLDGESLTRQLDDPAQPTDQIARSWWGRLSSVITPGEQKIYDGKTLTQSYELGSGP